MKITKPLPVQRRKCRTCPFRPGAELAHLAPSIALSAMFESIRICHSTGDTPATAGLFGKQPIPARACAGAREAQLHWAAGIGLIDAPTEAAWQATCDKFHVANGVKYPP